MMMEIWILEHPEGGEPPLAHILIHLCQAVDATEFQVLFVSVTQSRVFYHHILSYLILVLHPYLHQKNFTEETMAI